MFPESLSMQTSSVFKLEGCKILAFIKPEINDEGFVNHSVQITLQVELRYTNLSHIKTNV